MRVVRELTALLRLGGYRRLLAVRLTSQAGDGLFQAGLATLVFFSPERATTATGVAAAFSVVLLPFTLVGPWVGVLLDRWYRRQTLAVGNLVRALLTATTAALVLAGAADAWLYLLALATLSVNRFLLAALSASLPRVVDGPLLITANSLTPTLGTIAYAVGGAGGLGLGLVLPDGAATDAGALAGGALAMAAAALLARRFARTALGPDRLTGAEDVRRGLADLAHGFLAGARHLRERRTPWHALLVMALHRFLYGVVFVASVLIARNLLSDPADPAAGLATYGLIGVAFAVGFAAAVVVTPVWAPRVGAQRWIVWSLLLAAVSQTVLAVTASRPSVLLGAAVLGLAAQSAKIAVDTIVQRDTADAFRGRAFALYDVGYNAAFVSAAVAAALLLPDTGWSRPAFGALAVGYLLTAAWFARAARADARALATAA